MKTITAYPWIFILLILILGIALCYTDINIAKEPDTQLFLTSYDTQVNETTSVCFTYYSDINDFSVALNENNVANYQQNGNQICILPESLRFGDNTISMQLNTLEKQNVFFHVNKAASAEKETLQFVKQDLSDNDEKNPILMFFAAIVVFFLPGVFFTTRFFKEDDFISFFAITLTFSIILVTFLFWILDALSILNVWSLLASVLLISVFFFALSAKKFKFPKLKLEKKYLYLIMISIAIVLLSQLYFQAQHSPWSVYYERQAEEMYASGGWHNYDELSYLGRNFTYVPSYMFLRASYGWLSATPLQNSLSFFMLLGNLFFLCALLFLAKTLKFDFLKTVVLVMFFYSSVFIFGWLSIALLHLFAFSLFLIAVALALRGNMLSFVVAATAALFHALFLFLFPFIIFALQKKVNWKNLALCSFAAMVLFFLVYYPVLEANGMPTEIQKEKWGYLISGGTDIASLGTMTAGMASLAVLLALFFAFRKCQELKLATLVVILVLAFIFISYRMNIPLTIVAGVFLAEMFGRHKINFKSNYFKVLIVLFVLSISLSLWVYHAETGGPKILNPFLFVAEYTPQDTRILVEPFYGHTATYFSKRLVLADLYVEYAIDEQYVDSLDFIATGDSSILKKWDISYTITMRKERIVGIKEFVRPQTEIEYPELDKIYSNDKFNIHYYNERKDEAI